MESYADLEYAGEYFSKRLHSEAWEAAVDAVKEAALRSATRAIDRQPFSGRKGVLTQTLAFPRYPDSAIPDPVRQACCEEALALLERGNSQRRRLQEEGVQTFSLGNMSESYMPGAGKGLLSLTAKELLRPWIAGSVMIQ